MSRLVSSLGQLIGALAGLVLIVAGLSFMATNTGPGDWLLWFVVCFCCHEYFQSSPQDLSHSISF